MSEMYEPQTQDTSVYTPQVQEPVPTQPLSDPNPLLGTVGAILFSLAGVALYVIIYQLGIIAGIVGFVIFWLAQFGFGVLGKCKGNVPMSGLVVSIVVTAVMLIVAEFIAVTLSTQSVLADEGFVLSLTETAELVMETFKTDSEASGVIMSDLIFSFIFAGVAIVSHIVQKRKKAA